ncbi:MAG: cellulose biosynthesis protein BcsS, partial [Rhizobiales bacterium]|nr:cellulose biosynthesis protein BcsS [Hyphomicrobiales bacterium]
MPGFRNRSWGCVIAAVLFACKPGAASAQTPASSGPDDLVGGATPERFLFYSGFDLWNFGYAGYAGAR